MQAEKTWQLQEAKSRLSEVIKQAAIAPQFITLRGVPVAVIVSMDKYKQLNKPEKRILEILGSAPLGLDELELPEREAEDMPEILF
jgi:prevent-host-death family protein